MRAPLAIVGWLFLGAACARHPAAASPAAEVEPISLDAVVALSGHDELKRDGRAILERGMASADPLVAALAVAIAYPHDRDRYAAALYDAFSVEDHLARAAGDVVAVKPKEVQGALEYLQTGPYASQPLFVSQVKAFQEWRDANAWLVQMDTSVSVARALRSVALGSLWTWAERKRVLDTLSVLDALDAQARAKAAEPAEVLEPVDVVDVP